MSHKMSIADLHSDFLSYLDCDPDRTPFDVDSLCTYPQLIQGGVGLQTLAIYAPTEKGSVEMGERQLKIFHSLVQEYPRQFKLFEGSFPPPEGVVALMAAIENSSAFCSETEPLDSGLNRLQRWLDSLPLIAYISLTWNGENRFGGGTGSDRGLKEDGRTLLHWLSHKNVAVDLSHTSDPLAFDILNEIDAYGLNIPILASHSNFRAIWDHPRNLSNELAKEIISRRGVIGLNFLRKFVGPSSDYLFRHLEHGWNLGASMVFGADLFEPKDFPHLANDAGAAFFPEFATAACYPQFFAKIPLERLQELAHGKLLQFFANKNRLKSS